MVRLNNMRFENIINSFTENLEDIEVAINWYTNYSSNDNKVIAKERLLKKSIRESIASIYKITEDYIGMILKKVGLGVTDKSFKDCVNIVTEKGFFTEEYKLFLFKNLKVRNINAHQYNCPSTEDLIKLYNDNKEILYNVLYFMKSLLNKQGKSKINNLTNF